MKKTLLGATILLTTIFSSAALAQNVTYEIDPTHTFVTFEAKHFATSTSRGRFDKKQGTIVLDKVAKTGKADITIDTASISTGVKPFDGHLVSKDFFNVAEFPTARFVGDKFTFDGAKVTAVAGTLTLLGKSLPATLTAINFNCYDNPRSKVEVCGGDFETTITRSAYGMTFGLPVIPDNIRMTIQIEAARQ